MSHTRTLRDGRVVTIHRNHGLFKECDCPRRAWPKCSHSWHFSFKPKGGKAYRFSLDRHFGKHIETREDAETKADELRAKIRAGDFDTKPRGPSLADLTIEHLFDEYKTLYLNVERKATLENLDYQIGRIKRTLVPRPGGEPCPFGEWHVVDVVTGTIEQFRFVRRAAGTIAANRDLSLLRSMFNWAILNGYSERTPFKRGTEPAVRLTRETPRSRRLTAEEADALLTACRPWLRAIVEAALETGMRRGELLSLQWEQVRWKPKAEIFLPASKTKTRRDRRIPISSRLKPLLEIRHAAFRGVLELKDDEECPGDRYVFGNELGERMITFKRAWESAMPRAHGYKPAYVTLPPAQAGLGTAIDGASKGQPRRTAALTPECRQQLRSINLHFHDLRREAGSRWLEGGVPLHTVRDWLGHANISQTSTYLEGTIQGQHDAMRQFDERRGAASQQSETGADERLQNAEQSPASTSTSDRKPSQTTGSTH